MLRGNCWADYFSPNPCTYLQIQPTENMLTFFQAAAVAVVAAAVVVVGERLLSAL